MEIEVASEEIPNSFQLLFSYCYHVMNIDCAVFSVYTDSIIHVVAGVASRAVGAATNHAI